jgi:hypothetical protein
MLFPKSADTFGLVFQMLAARVAHSHDIAALGTIRGDESSTENREPSLLTFWAPTLGSDENVIDSVFRIITADIAAGGVIIADLFFLPRVNTRLPAEQQHTAPAMSALAEEVKDATNVSWVEVPCQRTISGENFAAGVADWAISIGRPSVLLMGQSYFRLELEVLGAGDPAVAKQPQIHEAIALAENAVGNAFSSCYFTAGGQSVSQCVNYAAQAGAVHMRTTASGAWLRSLGESSYAAGASFSERCAKLSQSRAFDDGAAADYAGKATPTGLSGLGDCRESFYKPVAAGQFLAATVAVANNTGILTGVGTAFSGDDVGSTMMIDGVRYTVNAFVDATHLVVEPQPAQPIDADSNWYCIHRELLRSSESRNKIQILWRPPCGIFDFDGTLGSGDYRLTLSPSASYAAEMVETLNPAAVPGRIGLATSTYTINVLSMQFYAATAQMAIPDQVQELHLREYQVMSKTLVSENSQLSFAVPASTTRLHMFIQDGRAGSTPNQPPSRFTVANGSDLNLQALQVTFANQTRPATRWSSGFSEEPGRSRQYLTQLYTQGKIEASAADSVGGVETLNEWLTRGPLYTWDFARDQADRSTEVTIAIQYGNPEGDVFDTRSKFFLVAEFDRAVEITTQSGLVVGVRSLNV